MLSTRLKGAGGAGRPLLEFIGHAYARSTTNNDTITFDSPSVTILSGDLLVFSGFWDDGSTGIKSVSAAVSGGWAAPTAIQPMVSGSEYPKGGSFYKIAQQTNPTIYITNTDDGYTDATDTLAGACMIFRPSQPIGSITVGTKASSNGPSALSNTIGAQTPATVAADTVYVFGNFVCGRPMSTSVQNPTTTYTQSGWTHVDGDGNRSGVDDMDYGYKLLFEGETSVSEQVDVTDAGHQAQILFALKVGF